MIGEMRQTISINLIHKLWKEKKRESVGNKEKKIHSISQK
jgi:hypothetical protein